jgi:hypothetical protein
MAVDIDESGMECGVIIPTFDGFDAEVPEVAGELEAKRPIGGEEGILKENMGVLFS